MSKAIVSTTENGVAVPTTHDLVARIVENNPTPEVLHQALDLMERMDARAARKAFFDAVSSFQERITEVPKDGKAEIATKKGGRYGYTYARLEDITRAIRVPLRECGLSYGWTVEDGATGNINVICILRHIDGHEERATFPVPTATDAAMSAAQKNGSALTYGKRQSLTSVLGLTMADEDPDAPRDPRELEEISSEQMRIIDDLIEEVGADRDKLLAYFEVETIGALNQTQYARAMQILYKKQREQS